jgi:hypothetical protein
MYAQVLCEQDTFHDRCCPTILSEDDPILESWDETRGKHQAWMEEGELMAV